MLELELIVDFYKYIERQWPGSEKNTLKALNFIDIEKDTPLKILDIGCWTWSQTLTLAKYFKWQIIAVDLFGEFLDILNKKATKINIGNDIKTIKCSMDKLPFENNEFDIIWSEWAIYNIWFENWVKYWKNFLKEWWYIALSEITWITNARPKQIQNHRDQEYSEIDTASNKIRILEENWFKPVWYFIIPKECWIDNYYWPMKDTFKSFLDRNNYSEIAKSIVENEQKEMNLYSQYNAYYSYWFYIAKKI